jgi:acyl-homoserine-lactone acylase
MRAGNSWRYHRRPAPDHSGTALNKAADYLREHFGRLDPPPVEVVRPRQGKVGLPPHQGRCSAPIHSYNSRR